jgi:hypothetical protein
LITILKNNPTDPGFVLDATINFICSGETSHGSLETESGDETSDGMINGRVFSILTVNYGLKNSHVYLFMQEMKMIIWMRTYL